MASDYSTKAAFCSAALALLNRAVATLYGILFFSFKAKEMAYPHAK